MSDRLKMLEHKQRKDKEQIKTLKPKMLNKAKHCRETVHSFNEIHFLSFVNICFITWSDRESGDSFLQGEKSVMVHFAPDI